MTEPSDAPVEPPVGTPGQSAAPTAPEPATELPRRGGRSAVLWLAAMLALVVAAVGGSPYWAPPVMALLPWGADRLPDTGEVSRRVDAIDQQLAAAKQSADQLTSTVTVLSGRIDQLAAAGGDVVQARAALAALSQRVDQLAGAQQSAGAERQQVQQQVAALQAKLAAQPAVDPATIAAMQQQLTRLDGEAASLANLVAAVEKAAAAAPAADPTDAALVLTLLQIREAVAQGRPFQSEYDAFQALAGSRPDIAAAAAPLAAAAKSGVAGHAVLAQRLAELAGKIATATAPPPSADWREQALSHLRGLVTVRRIDGPNQTPAEAAVSTAQQALATGDLAGAVAALAPLPAPNAEAAAPWLQMARDRLQVETALARVQGLLVARLAPASTAPHS